MARPIPQVGTVEDGYRFKGGDPKSRDAWEPLSGEAYLSAIPQQRANLVRGIIQGRLPYPTPTRQSYGSGPQLANQLLQDVGMAEPGFDATIYGERKKAREAAVANYAQSTVGSTGGKLLSANQIMRHAQTLVSKLPEVNNADFTPSNWVLNNIGSMMGGNQLKPYSLARDALVGETEKFFSGNAPTEGRMKDLAENLSPSGSYGQKTEGVRTLIDLVGGQLDPIAKRWNELTGDHKRPEDFLEPDARSIFLKYRAMEQKPPQPPAQAPMLQQMQSQRAPMQPLGAQQSAPGAVPQPVAQQVNPTDDLLKKYGL